jgi:hypothetical protein
LSISWFFAAPLRTLRPRVFVLEQRATERKPTGSTHEAPTGTVFTTTLVVIGGEQKAYVHRDVLHLRSACKEPDYDFMEPLVDAIITDLTPFGQYWGIQALGKLIEQQPTHGMNSTVSGKLKTYYNGLTKGTDREYELKKILPAINK